MENQLKAKQLIKMKKEKEKQLQGNEIGNIDEIKNASVQLEEAKIIEDKELNAETIVKEEEEVKENRVDHLDPDKNDIILNIKDQKKVENNQVDIPLDDEKLNSNYAFTNINDNNNVESNNKFIYDIHGTENKEVDNDSPLLISGNMINNKSDNLKMSSNVENIISKNREVDENIFSLEKNNIANYQHKDELNFKQKRDYSKINEIETKQIKAQEEENLEFVHHQELMNLSKDFNIIFKQNNKSSDSIHY